ncbi:hypothetical protein FHS18_000203 [Paenibacillus phyllosphaerae]|uniref:Uncharacterized protein n=1 Tax=Paenibacillus phyllosphaerae TaxID=274593 RepID=A0A7W5FKH5_9BACL|nr:hypothetical protein [Paenibacillus phyllosphaerae]MBB3108175.1 hypothetical protein [Paenibacillus phyllosphaerae]
MSGKRVVTNEQSVSQDCEYISYRNKVTHRVGPSIHGTGEKKYVKLISGKVDDKKPSFA